MRLILSGRTNAEAQMTKGQFDTVPFVLRPSGIPSPFGLSAF
jgi:hypothetical protein